MTLTVSGLILMQDQRVTAIASIGLLNMHLESLVRHRLSVLRLVTTLMIQQRHGKAIV